MSHVYYVIYIMLFWALIEIFDRYDTDGDGDGLVLMDWYEIEVGQRSAGNNHEYYIKIRFDYFFFKT